MLITQKVLSTTILCTLFSTAVYAETCPTPVDPDDLPAGWVRVTPPIPILTRPARYHFVQAVQDLRVFLPTYRTITCLYQTFPPDDFSIFLAMSTTTFVFPGQPQGYWQPDRSIAGILRCSPPALPLPDPNQCIFHH